MIINRGGSKLVKNAEQEIKNNNCSGSGGHCDLENGKRHGDISVISKNVADGRELIDLEQGF